MKSKMPSDNLLINIIRDTRCVGLEIRPIDVIDPLPGGPMNIPEQLGLWLLLADDRVVDETVTIYLMPLLCPVCKQTVHYKDDEIAKIKDRLWGKRLGDILYMEGDIIPGETFANLDVQLVHIGQTAHSWLQLLFVDDEVTTITEHNWLHSMYANSGKGDSENDDVPAGFVLCVHPISFLLTHISIESAELADMNT